MTAKIGAPSIWLRLSSFYFMLGGALFLGIAVLGLVSGLALPSPQLTEGVSYPLAIVIVSAMGVSLLATGILLMRRLRAGAVLGLVLTLYPLAFALIRRRNMDWFELEMMALTVIVLLGAWRELEWRHGSDSVSAPPTDHQ